MQRHIVVLGDSLTVSPSPSESFPSQLQKRVDATRRPGWVVVNAGVRGDTTAGGLRRIDEAITRETRILILALGANDGLRGVAVATIEKNLSAITERAQARNIRVLLCGMETPPTHGWNYTVEFHRLFPRIAERYRMPLVPFLLAGVALNAELNLEDAIHPNAAGAARIAETVWPYLEALIQQESILERAAARPLERSRSTALGSDEGPGTAETRDRYRSAGTARVLTRLVPVKPADEKTLSRLSPAGSC